MGIQKIGILGYGGRMGQALCRIMPKQLELRLGQRHISRLEREHTEYQQVDICNHKSLWEFTEGLTMLINCAGPSMKLLDFAAVAAAERGIPYIDAFGGALLEERLKEKNRTGSFVINAGSFPGLTGILPIAMAETYFDKVLSFALRVDNYESWGFASAWDFVLSAVNHFGKGNYYYRDGEFVRSAGDFISGDGNQDCIGFEYINAETVAVAKRLRAKEAHFIQIRHAGEENGAMQELVQEYIRTRDEKALERRIRECIKNQPPMKEYFKITCEMRGSLAGEERKLTEELCFSDSYLAGAAVIRHCAVQLEKLEYPIGIKSACEVAQPEQLIEECEGLGAEKNIFFEEDLGMEEGDIL